MVREGHWSKICALTRDTPHPDAINMYDSSEVLVREMEKAIFIPMTTEQCCYLGECFTRFVDDSFLTLVILL